MTANLKMRQHYPIMIPLTADGSGPASIDEASSVVFQVWDQACEVHGESPSLLQMVLLAESLNEEDKDEWPLLRRILQRRIKQQRRHIGELYSALENQKEQNRRLCEMIESQETS